MTGQELERVLKSPISDAVLQRYGWKRDAVERLLQHRVQNLVTRIAVTLDDINSGKGN